MADEFHVEHAERSPRTDASTPTDTAEREPLATTRRRYLASAAALGVAAPAVLSGSARAETFADRIEAYSDRFDTIIDVTEAGVDNTGNQPITEDLRKLRGDDTLLVFPPGEYYMDEQFRFTGFENVGLLGNDATIRPANIHEYDGPQYRLFRLGVHYRPGRDLLFEGFTVDQRADDTGVRVIEGYVTDGLEVRDIELIGQHDSGVFGPALFGITDPAGTGVVERFTSRAGGAWVDDTPDPLGFWRGPTGMLLSTGHKGTIDIVDCALGAFPDNGLYACTSGTVRVIGGRYANSNAASIRLGGDNCVVRGSKVVVDENREHFTNQRGIRLDYGSNFTVDDVTIDLPAANGHAVTVKKDVDSARINNTRVTVGDRVNHGIVVSPGAGPTDIVETNIKMEGGGNAIQINGGDEGPVVVERVQIWGPASGTTFRNAIRCVRNDCEFRGVQIWQPGPAYRRAIELTGDDGLVYDCELKSSHHPLWVNGDGAWIESNYLESYDGYQAIRLNDSSSNATVKRNTLVNGVLDKGCDGLRMYGNEIL